MSEQIFAILKRKLDDLAANGEVDAETRRNALKEELQFYVLNFIYHHPEYSNWIMYGGSALRIIHGLNRMSVDLDFEVPHAVNEKFLNRLKKEVGEYFASNYGTDSGFLTIKTVSGRSLLLKFHVGDALDLGHPSKQVHVKIDFNHFAAPNTVTERRPINQDQHSFAIKTYNMSALMASKIAAIFLREQRDVGKKKYDYKGRDIYDLLWYMNKKIVPDFDYLVAKDINIKNPRALFDRLTIDILNYEKMDNLLKEDLMYLFENQFQFENWFSNWRKDYMRLLDEYEINTIAAFEGVTIHQSFYPDNFSFIYQYKTEKGGSVRVIYTISDYWIRFGEGDLSIKIGKELKDKIEFTSNGSSSRSAPQDKLEQYAELFRQKTENYFKKTNNIMLGDSIDTKLIRMTADKLNQKEQIMLNKSALLSCELDDLLK